MDRQSCLLRFLCELEGSRHEAEKNNLRLDPDLEEDLILLKVAKYVVLLTFLNKMLCKSSK